MRQATIRIEGMSCGHCVAAVRGALGGLPGVQVEEVRVGSATVRFDPAQAAPERLAEAVRAEGYGATLTEG